VASLRLALRGLWWRRGLSVAILLVAVTTVLAAAVGPLYARAGGESILQDTLRAAPTRDVGMEITNISASNVQPLAGLDGLVDDAGPLPGYQPRIRSLQFNGRVLDARGQDEATSLLVFRDGACDHLIFVQGRCPSGPAESAVSARSLLTHPWGLGARLPMKSVGTGFGEVTTRVVGIYRPQDRSEPHWFDQEFFNAHLSGGDAADVSDAIFTSQATFDRAQLGTRVVIQLPLDVARVRLADEAALRSRTESFQNTVNAGGTATTTTALDEVLGAADNSRHRLEISVLIVAGQLLVLSWFVLYLVVANASEARGPEIALAKLRGLTSRGTVAFGLLEPVVVIALAAPLGLLVARLAVEALARIRLLPGTPVLFTSLSVWVTLAALAGGIAAAALAARRTLTRPVVEQWRRTSGEQPLSRASAYVDAAVVALALLGLLQLRLTGALRDGHVNHLVLLAPGLVALAAALAGVRLLPALAAAAVRRTRGSPRLGRFVALRQVARRPTGLRVVVLLAVAFGLTTFAVSAWSVASANRAARAATDVGAERVLTVEPKPGVDLMAAVRRLDPAGRAAMAAAELLPFGGQPGGRLLAVDSSRLAAVATWRSDFAADPLTSLAAKLHPPGSPPIVLTGTELHALVTASSLTGSPRAELWVDVDSPDFGPQSESMGRIRSGQHDYVAGLERCRLGCRLVGLSVRGAPADFTPHTGRLVFTGLTAGAGPAAQQAVAVDFTDLRRWKPYTGAAPAERSEIVSMPDGLGLQYASDGSDVPGISPNDTPARLPAVIAAGTLGAVPPGRSTEVTGLDGNGLQVTVANEVRVLPRATANGTLVDLEYARRMLGGRGNVSSPQVWLSAAAPADFAARLESAGVDVLSADSTVAHRELLGRQGPALALLLFLYAAGLAALLAAGGTVVSVYLSGRRRAFELAAMLAVGVPRRKVIGACVGEQLMLLLTAVALGTLAGFVGAALALPSMPTFVDDLAVPPLHYMPSPAAVGAFLLAALLVVAGTGAAAALLLVRSASPARLREVQA
jgi:putative ABC transport system permease protein